MSSVINVRAHHMHAVVEYDLPRFLPAYYAEVIIIRVILLVAECSAGRLQPHANIVNESCAAYTDGRRAALKAYDLPA